MERLRRRLIRLLFAGLGTPSVFLLGLLRRLEGGRGLKIQPGVAFHCFIPSPVQLMRMVAMGSGQRFDLLANGPQKHGHFINDRRDD